jgi:CDP-glycerol glycerophosphotransferase
MMVDTLERTGSDFAAGNARRFSPEKGSTQSWTHKPVFARTRLATSIRDFPHLIRDRMVWNKVYRRSFWDAGGYTFPAIRYEDYPVTLRAHLDAAAVDLHSAHVYHWRDRVSGDSITQQTFHPGNARDRAASAHMVLDLLTPGVPEEIVAAVHGYFIEVDLVALAVALATAPAANQFELETLAAALAARLELHPDQPVKRLARLVHTAMQDGDWEVVRALSRWREGGTVPALAKELVGQRRLHRMLPVLSAVVRRRGLPNPAAPRKLKSQLIGTRTAGTDLCLGIDVVLRRQFAARVRGRVDLVADDARVQVATTFERRGNGLRLDVVVPGDRLVALGDAPSTLDITLWAGPMRWRGRVKIGLDAVPPLWQAAPGHWVQPGREPGTWFLRFVRVDDPVRVLAAVATATGFELTLSEDDGDLVIELPYPSADVVVPMAGGLARIDVAQLQAADPPDNPVTGEVERHIGYRKPGPERLTRFHGTFETADVEHPLPSNPVLPSTPWESLRQPYLSVPQAGLILGGEVVALRGSRLGHVTVARQPQGEHLQVADEPGVDVPGT